LLISCWLKKVDNFKVRQALMVIGLDKNIRWWLRENDPMALKQVEEALEMDDEVRKELSLI